MKHIYMRGQVAGGQWPVESGGAVPALNHNRNHNRRLRIPSFCQKHGVKKIRPNFPSDISDSIFLTKSLVIRPVRLSAMVFLSADGSSGSRPVRHSFMRRRIKNPSCFFCDLCVLSWQFILRSLRFLLFKTVFYKTNPFFRGEPKTFWQNEPI